MGLRMGLRRAHRGDVPKLLDGRDFRLFGADVPYAADAAAQDALLWRHDCGDAGCLFDVRADPSERADLAADGAHAARRASMRRLLARLNEDVFEPARGEESFAACEMAMAKGGFYGPWIDADEWYTPVPPAWDARQRARNLRLRPIFAAVNRPAVQERLIELCSPGPRRRSRRTRARSSTSVLPTSRRAGDGARWATKSPWLLQVSRAIAPG